MLTSTAIAILLSLVGILRAEGPVRSTPGGTSLFRLPPPLVPSESPSGQDLKPLRKSNGINPRDEIVRLPPVEQEESPPVATPPPLTPPLVNKPPPPTKPPFEELEPGPARNIPPLPPPASVMVPPPEQQLPLPASVYAAVRTPRANTSSDAQSWMSRYQSRIGSTSQFGEPRATENDAVPADFVPWWDPLVRRPINPQAGPLAINIANLNDSALRHSSYVQVIASAPDIRQTQLVQELAAFDWKAFLESTYNNFNDPVGNTLTTGNNSSRYKNQTTVHQGGLRQRNTYGGEVEVFQQFGTQANNSRFLLPNPQRTTRMQLQYTQPLLRGAGRAYNESQIVLAQIQVNQSSDEVAAELQEHLVKVTEAYWELYRSRAEFLQRQRLLTSAEGILANLVDRREIDAVERQVFRARTAVAKRKSELIRAGTVVRNWESQLRLLVNDPLLVESGGREYTPSDSPLLQHVELDLSESLHTALLNRPDISQVIRDVRGAAVILGVAQQDILPRLDMVATTYVAGLAAGADQGESFGNQFSQGRPSASVGMEFEVPLGNRAANAQAERRQLELARSMSRFRLTVEQALTTVEIAVREVDTSYREMVAKYHVMRAASSEAAYLYDRWQVLPSNDDSAPQLLDSLLDTQERVADEEGAMVRAQVSYALAIVQLKREMGTLLRVYGPEVER